MRALRYLVFLALGVACGDDGGGARDGEDGWLARLETPEDLARLSVDGDEVKYLAAVAGKTPPEPLTGECWFQDMHRWQWHIDFLHGFPALADLSYSAYVAMVLARASRLLWGGAVSAWPTVPHPKTHAPGIIAYSLYAESQPGSLTVADVIEVDATLARCIPFATEQLVFVPTDGTQKQLAVTQKAALAAADVDVVMPENLRPGPAGSGE